MGRELKKTAWGREKPPIKGIAKFCHHQESKNRIVKCVVLFEVSTLPPRQLPPLRSHLPPRHC